MILLTYHSDDGLLLGVKTAQGVLNVRAACQHFGVDSVLSQPDHVFAAGLEVLPALRDLAAKAADANLYLAESALAVGAPVPNPGKILCIGLNYRRHAEESGMKIPQTPVLFSKFSNTIAAPGEAVPLPANALEYDYEAELVVVIGRRARYISEADALNYVLGYCNGNDVSARDLQRTTSQWLLGKTLDKFLPLGPYLLTADEVPDPQNLSIKCWLNGELRQNSNTADMIFSVAQIISYISQYMPLEPGDIISTGTPEGVIFGMAEKVWMKPGDQTIIEIEGMGRLVNRMAGE